LAFKAQPRNPQKCWDGGQMKGNGQRKLDRH
jgi:hypothetical protein